MLLHRILTLFSVSRETFSICCVFSEAENGWDIYSRNIGMSNNIVFDAPTVS